MPQGTKAAVPILDIRPLHVSREDRINAHVLAGCQHFFGQKVKQQLFRPEFVSITLVKSRVEICEANTTRP